MRSEPAALDPRALIATHALAALLQRWPAGGFGPADEVLAGAARLAVSAADALLAALEDDRRPAA
jgi:hypothetical protein